MTIAYPPSDSARDSLPHPAFPEPVIAELERFLVHSPLEIAANLRLLIDERVLSTVYFNQGENFFVTCFLSVNSHFGELIFDLAPDQWTNEKLPAANGMTVVSFLDRIKFQFTVNRAELTQFRGEPAFRVGTPRSILRLQRRTAFRARTQVVNSPSVLLSPIAGASDKTDMVRLRIAEISASGFSFSAPTGRPRLMPGMTLQGCRLELRGNEWFDVDIEIRQVSTFKDGLGREMCRAGCRLLKIAGAAEMAIQRYVNHLAVAGSR
jgi:c-di-GMP-binding flagellar brake protein YcgR